MKLLRFCTITVLTLASSPLVVAREAPEKSASQTAAEEIGSLRNARVAVPMTEAKTDLTYFADSISDKEKAEVARLAPNVRIVTGLSQKEALARAGEAHGIDGSYASPEFLNNAKNLSWVQAMSAGVDRYITIEPLIKNDAVILTNNRGVHGPAIADHAMAMLLSLTRNLPFYSESQAEGRWANGRPPRDAVALDGMTMLVVGLGGIGTEIAERAHGFGMRVIGTRRSDSPSPDFIQRVGKPEDLLAMLPEADVVAIAVPLTPETTDLINEAAFSAMKRGSYLVNIARGKIVDTDAMVAALKSDQLAGACLDVTDPEPLPKNHPLWHLPNVIITPHVAARSKVTEERRSALLVENLRRFGAGEPLLNVVDKVAGY